MSTSEPRCLEGRGPEVPFPSERPGLLRAGAGSRSGARTARRESGPSCPTCWRGRRQDDEVHVRKAQDPSHPLGWAGVTAVAIFMPGVRGRRPHACRCEAITASLSGAPLCTLQSGHPVPGERQPQP
ncbi:hypothetical protein HJG60_008098 [Phyllostomus discolor]|uniref:Uncharacterized protein n=1 Tax=Phyllostomus discolor TaxID=89673 RepID=A0A834BEK0_9CHIR|nr:hypothetical protein HJG60_008098 [Phyllostomus discolor]